MLLDGDGQLVDFMPQQAKFDAWRERLPPGDYAGIVAALNAFIDARDSFESSWTLDSLGPALERALLTAAGGNPAHSAEFMRLLVWDVIRVRPDEWKFYQAATSEDQTGGMYFFRRQQRRENHSL